MDSFIPEQQLLEHVREQANASEPAEGARMAQSRFLDELPGAAFGAVTLVWIILSFAHLIW